MYDMLPDKMKMKQNSESVYQKIVQLSRCKLSELQVLCNLEDTELCMTLIYLLQREKIRQEWSDEGIYYCL